MLKTLFKQMFVQGIFCILQLCFVSLFAQQDIQLQVVKHTIEKDIPFNAEQKLKIEGEKSELEIISWDKNFIHLHLTLVSKHPELATAKKHLKLLEHEVVISTEQILIKNSIAESEESNRSGLKAVYVLSIPKNCKLELSNYFGKANITDLSHGLNITSEFCNVEMENITGNVLVDTYYGDLIGVMINGEMNLRARRSNVTLSEISGKFDIKAYKGSIKVFANQSYLDLNIEADKTDVFFYDPVLASYNFNLKSRNGEIELPDNLLADYDFTNPEIKNAVIKPDSDLVGVRVAINVSYGDIKIASK